jgi:hypothetical protein
MMSDLGDDCERKRWSFSLSHNLDRMQSRSAGLLATDTLQNEVFRATV